ncbi:hypothetical protein KIH74_32605 [Kineosporia sp. J2-2]|uniref:Uncharacterized protein n=1 Tax=Kineosporia corallincola TaxID=2835133 RepID=A0ABS5TSG7_9ACTN|nr:hypothetical protein [Kineosporia corallincola]MBT0773732.1 hypothetical protein [Kineosporia corallincola]
MHDDVACIIGEIRRLTTPLPGARPVAAGPDPRPAGPLTPAVVLRLPVAARHVLALAAQGHPVSRIALLTATAPALADSRLRYAAGQLGLSPDFGTDPGVRPRPGAVSRT